MSFYFKRIQFTGLRERNLSEMECCFFPFSLVYLLYLANLVYLTAGEAKISLTLSSYEKKRFSLMLIQYRNGL